VTGKSIHDPRTTTHALAAAALALLLAACPAAAGDAEWKMLHDQATAHLQRNSLQQAELFAREALREAESSASVITPILPLAVFWRRTPMTTPAIQ